MLIDTNIITVQRFPDPVVEEWGATAQSLYAEMFWLPVVGPTALLTFRRLNLLLTGVDELDVDLNELAGQMGLAFAPRQQSAFTRSMHRLIMFGLAYQPLGSNRLQVRQFVPSVPLRHQKRWSPALIAMHDQHVMGQRAERATI